MATGKKFYWLKLKVDFLNSEVIDYILSQKNGSDYLAIYLILCTKTINTQGELVNQLGEVIIPYDVEKIQRDCKHFHIDTIRVAMELFSKLKLIYMQENGVLKITGYEEMVGSSTDYAKQKALQRKKVDNGVDNVHIEIRDKRLEIRDIDTRKEDTKIIGLLEESCSKKSEQNEDMNLLFEEFWRRYPKKQSKKQAQQSFMKLKLNQELIDTIFYKLEKFKISKQWKKNEGQFIPMASTWLNNRRWEDEIDKDISLGDVPFTDEELERLGLEKLEF